MVIKTEHKHLGIVIDEPLKFQVHFKEVILKQEEVLG